MNEEKAMNEEKLIVVYDSREPIAIFDQAHKSAAEIYTATCPYEAGYQGPRETKEVPLNPHVAIIDLGLFPFSVEISGQGIFISRVAFGANSDRFAQSIIYAHDAHDAYQKATREIGPAESVSVETE
jgi:hypothetical protein